MFSFFLKWRLPKLCVMVKWLPNEYIKRTHPPRSANGLQVDCMQISLQIYSCDLQCKAQFTVTIYSVKHDLQLWFTVGFTVYSAIYSCNLQCKAQFTV